MTSSQLRTSAREALKGKWGKSALITLIYIIISYVISIVAGFIPVFGSIALYVISIPLSFGLLVTFIKLKRNEEVSYLDFFTFGFSKFSKVWAVLGNMALKLIVPIILIIIFIILMSFGGVATLIDASSYSSVGFSGIVIIGFIGYIASLIYLIVKGYLYSLSFYVLNDNPDKTGKEIVEESENLMMHNRWSFFWLGLTFFGWVILASFTCGIGFLWLMPYIQVTFVCFYESLAGFKEEEKTISVNENE